VTGSQKNCVRKRIRTSQEGGNVQPLTKGTSGRGIGPGEYLALRTEEMGWGNSYTIKRSVSDFRRPPGPIILKKKSQRRESGNLKRELGGKKA